MWEQFGQEDVDTIVGEGAHERCIVVIQELLD